MAKAEHPANQVGLLWFLSMYLHDHGAAHGPSEQEEGPMAMVQHPPAQGQGISHPFPHTPRHAVLHLNSRRGERGSCREQPINARTPMHHRRGALEPSCRCNSIVVKPGPPPTCMTLML